MTGRRSDNQGLAAAEQIYQNRAQIGRELKDEGKKIAGYFCCYPPLEIMTAAGFVPYRIMGNVREPITRADAHLETIMCPFVRSCFDIGIKGDHDFFEGFVSCHSCDNIEKLYNIWWYTFKPSFSHFINVPHMIYPTSFEFFEEELRTFKKEIERFIGKEISDEDLNQAIQLHNRNRALVRELYSLRKQDPPLISGTEMTKTIVSVMSLPVEEANGLLQSIIEEIKERSDGPQKKPARLLIYGAELDNTDFVELVEGSGANVVMDDHCTGSRSFWHDVELSDDPLGSISSRYLGKLTCPRTFKLKTGTRQDDLGNRFGHLKDFAKEYNVNGVILYTIRYCDSFEFDVPDVRDYLQAEGLPVLHIEDEYTMLSIARLKTRIEAFLEMMA